MVTLKTVFGDDAGVLRDQNFKLLLAITVLVPFGNGLLSPILDSLIDPFGASPASIGLMVSVFVAPAIVIIPIAGVLADRFGRKLLVVPSALLFGLAGVAITFTAEFSVVLLLRFLQGIGWAGLTPLVVTSIGDLFAGFEETTAQGIRHTTAALSGSAVSLVAGALVVLAWQFPFFLYGIAVPLAAVFAVWYTEPERSGSAFAADGGLRQYRRALVELARRRRVLLVLVARTLPLGVWIGFVTYNSVIVVRLLDGTPLQAGILYAVGSFAMAVAASQAGRAANLTGNRYALLVIANAALGTGFTIVVFAPVIMVAVVGVMCFGVGFGLAIPVYRSLLTGFAPPELRAGLVSIGSAGSRVLLMVTPILMGAAIGGLTPVIGFAGAVQVAGVVVAGICGFGGILLVLAANAAPPVATGRGQHDLPG